MTPERKRQIDEADEFLHDLLRAGRTEEARRFAEQYPDATIRKDLLGCIKMWQFDCITHEWSS